MKAKKLFFKECHLAGRQYWDVDEVWDELHVGTILELKRDLENRHDMNAVAVVYNTIDERTGETEEYICWDISLVKKTRPSPNCLKWDGRIFSSAASANSIQMLTMRIKSD